MVKEDEKLEKELAAEMGIGNLIIEASTMRMIDEVVVRYFKVQ
jgi:hypothetical protein